MKKAIAVVVFSLSLVGCATASLNDASTPSDKRAALCMDAQSALALGSAAVGVAMGADDAAYWGKWLSGASVGVSLYCK